MARLTLFDHLFVLLVVVVFPGLSALRIESALAFIRKGGERARVAVYRQNVVLWLGFALVLWWAWRWLDRDLEALGVRWPAEGTWLGGAAAALIPLSYIGWSLKGLGRSADPAGALRSQLGALNTFLPKSRREERWFYALSVNAGFTEEFIFRGYLLWYLGNILEGVWPALLATLLFTWAHAYQGARLLPGIAATAAIMVGIYLYTSSLLLPVLLHIAMDAVQGRSFARFRRAAPSGP